MTGWWWCYDMLWLYKFRYIISWQSCIFGWMPYNIKYDFVVLSDGFDLLNRHTKNTTRRCCVYWPSVAPSQAAKWIWGFNFLNADSLRGVRGFLSHGGSPILLFLNHPAIFLGFPHLWKHTAPWSPCHRLHQVTKRRGDCKRTSPIYSNPSRGLIARGPFLWSVSKIAK